MVVAVVAFIGGNELESAVAMRVVVPGLESSHPGARVGQGVEGLVGATRMVFQGIEQSLGKGILISTNIQPGSPDEPLLGAY